MILQEALEKLQYDFVVEQIGQAVNNVFFANNVTFMCKTVYATTLLREFVVIGTPRKVYRFISLYRKTS